MTDPVETPPIEVTEAALEWLRREGPYGVVVTDDRLRIVVWNRWMENITGWDSAEVAGRSLTELYPDLSVRGADRYYASALEGQATIMAQRFHRYLLPIPRPMSRALMQQTARISPLRMDTRVVGTITVIEDVTDRVDREMELGAKIRELEEAQQKLVAHEEELRRLLDHERHLLSTLAQSFLGHPPHGVPLEIACRYRSAVQKERFGGDYFDFIDFGHKIGVIIGDVCGKGLRAGVYTAMAKYTLRAYALQGESPLGTIHRVNEALVPQMARDSLFVSLVYVLIDLETRTAIYVNAGHPAPLRYSGESRDCTALEPTGGLVGVLPEAAWDDGTVQLASGDILVFMTDGIIDVVRDDDPTVLCDLMMARASDPLDALADDIMSHAVTHGQDDVALVVLRIP